jgi:predicted Zn-dependent protease
MTRRFAPGFAAFLAGLCASSWLLLPRPVLAGEEIQDQLPEMGTAAQATLSLEDEYRIGRMVMRGLRDSGAVLDDPEISEYMQSLGLRLSSLAHDGTSDRQFNFFMVRDPGINAFALPGGFIGVNAGLMLETSDESELAGVLAHEVAHVTQRHIARGIESQSKASMVSTAAMLAAIILGAVGGGSGNATMGAVMAAQGMAVQHAINFTRENESEADRIGIGVLATAGFDPNAMPAFFETMFRRTQLGPDQVPEMLRSHPVTSTRIAESKDRAAQYPAVKAKDSLVYALMKERTRVLDTPAGADPRTYYASLKDGDPATPVAQVYGKALALTVTGDAARAVPVFQHLVAAYPQVLTFHTALGQAQLAAGDTKGALQTLEHALDIAPRNIPVTVRYGETLLQAGRPKKAHEVLLDLFNNVPPTQDQIRLTAMAANAAGDVADAYSYMAEYHIMSGDLPLAINQLELALSVPNISDVQRARYVARLKEMREALPKQRRSLDQQASGSRPGPNG